MTDSAPTSGVLDYAEPPRPRSAMRYLSSPWLLLPLILLAALALRWLQIGHESLWLDEFLAMQNSTGRGQFHVTFERDVVLDPAPQPTRLENAPGLLAIWTSLGTDSHPPLYFMVLHVWRQMFGDSDTAVRALSTVFSLVAVVLLFDVARLLHGPAVALWAALLMALAGPQIQYAQEARNYTMLLALMLGACDALVRLEKSGVNARRAAALGACVLAMMLTHYLALAAVAAMGIYALIRLRGPALKVAVTSFAVVGVVYALCWGPFLWEQAGGFSRELSAAEESSDDGLMVSEFKRLALLPLRYFTEPLKNSRAVGQLAIVMYIIPVLLLWRRRDLLLWCLIAGFVIFSVVVSDLLRPAHALAYVRYTFLATAPVYALAAGMLWHMKGFLRHLPPLVLSVACIAALEEPYSISKADTRDMATFLSSRCDEGDILIVHMLDVLDGRDWQAGTLYVGLAHYGAARSPVVFLDGPPSPQVDRRIRAARQVWMISPTPEVPNEQLLPGSEMIETKFFPWVGTAERVAWP